MPVEWHVTLGKDAYYVDATLGDDDNAGTYALPWQTIAKVNATALVAGNTVLFKRGETWAEMLTIPAAGTAGKPITFGAYGTGAKPIITGSGARNYCILDTHGYGYITIDGIQFNDALEEGVGNNYYSPPGTESSTPYWTVQNCTFVNCGVLLFGPYSIVQDNTLTGPQPPDADMGGVIFRGLVASHCSALRNTISGYYARGVWFYNGCDNPTANDNIVSDIDFTPSTSAEGYGINFDGFGRKITGTITCTGNTISDTAQVGIFLENCSDGSSVHGNLIHDTVTYGIWYKNYAAGVNNTDQRGNTINGIVDYNIIYNVNKGVVVELVKGVDIWNNVITKGTGTTSICIGTAGANTYIGNLDIRNNILGTDFTYEFRTVDAWETYVDAFDYNAVTTGTVIYEITSGVSHSLATLQGESAALNCFTTDPAFVDAPNNNYHLAVGSPCINTGVDVGLAVDYDDVAVSDPPEIGAFEY